MMTLMNGFPGSASLDVGKGLIDCVSWRAIFSQTFEILFYFCKVPPSPLAIDIPTRQIHTYKFMELYNTV